jgi:hypothetical protein
MKGRRGDYRGRVDGVGGTYSVHSNSVVSQQGATPEEDVDGRQGHALRSLLHNLQKVRSMSLR